MSVGAISGSIGGVGPVSHAEGNHELHKGLIGILHKGQHEGASALLKTPGDQIKDAEAARSEALGAGNKLL